MGDKIFEKIPSMTIMETITLWRNAIRVTSDEAAKSQHDRANNILHAISKEWARRGRSATLGDDYFKWPSTAAHGGSGEIDTESWLREGVLHFMGYRVGADGEARGMRERILSEIFRENIPPIFHKTYLNEWGKPNSPARLQKVAESIASFARNAKRRKDAKMYSAIKDWESDLEFLYYKFYVGKFHFAWPTARI